MGTNVYLLQMSGSGRIGRGAKTRPSLSSHWVEAVSRDMGALADHVKSIRLDDRVSLGIYAFPLAEPPPFYLIEDDFFHGWLCGCSWEVVGRKGAAEYLRHLQKRYAGRTSMVDDDQYCVLYGMGDKFFSPRPGVDNMGAIQHHHVDDDFLDEVKKRGWRSVERECFPQESRAKRRRTGLSRRNANA